MSTKSHRQLIYTYHTHTCFNVAMSRLHRTATCFLLSSRRVSQTRIRKLFSSHCLVNKRATHVVKVVHRATSPPYHARSVAELHTWRHTIQHVAHGASTVAVSKKQNSQTGTPTRVAWVKATYPNRLDYLGVPSLDRLCQPNRIYNL